MSDKRVAELEALALEEGFPLPMSASLIARLERAGYIVDLITGEVCSNVTVTTTPLAKTICHLLTPIYPERSISMNNETTVTLKIVAQSGHAWEETVNADDVQTTVETIVETHGDIERVERLATPDDLSGDIIWSFE